MSRIDRRGFMGVAALLAVGLAAMRLRGETGTGREAEERGPAFAWGDVADLEALLAEAAARLTHDDAAVWEGLCAREASWQWGDQAEEPMVEGRLRWRERLDAGSALTRFQVSSPVIMPEGDMARIEATCTVDGWSKTDGRVWVERGELVATARRAAGRWVLTTWQVRIDTTYASAEAATLLGNGRQRLKAEGVPIPAAPGA